MSTSAKTTPSAGSSGDEGSIEGITENTNCSRNADNRESARSTPSEGVSRNDSNDSSNVRSRYHNVDRSFKGAKPKVGAIVP